MEGLVLWSRLLFILSLSVVGYADLAYKCPQGISTEDSKVYKHNCYEFVVNEVKDYSDSQDYCKENGGNLALVKNKNINNFIGDTLESRYGLYSVPVWIGLYYSNGYKWVDGSSLGQYNNIDGRYIYSGVNCVAILPGSRTWREYKCSKAGFQDFTSHKKRFVCEYPGLPVTTTPLPTTKLPNSKTITVNDCPKNIPRDKNLQVFGDKCYMFKMTPRNTFTKANTYCKSLGGRLAIVNSAALDNFIQDELHNTYYSTYAAWIGLRYDSSKQSHYWVDGTKLSFKNPRYTTFYATNECIAISGYDGKWLDEGCSYYLPYVCEFMPVIRPKTIPTTLSPGVTTNVQSHITVNDCPKNIQRGKYLQVFGDKCYMFEMTSRKTFTDAESYCEFGGGKLATIDSSVIDKFVQSELHDTYGLRNYPAWIGLRYDSNDKSHHWVDGTPVYYTNFGQDTFYPSENCGAISAHDGMWLKKTCTANYLPFICEFKSTTTPSPGVTTKVQTHITTEDYPETHPDHHFLLHHQHVN